MAAASRALHRRLHPVPHLEDNLHLFRLCRRATHRIFQRLGGFEDCLDVGRQTAGARRGWRGILSNSFLVRHGESTLDVRNQILSNPSYKYDTTYGLTAKGVEQVHEAARIIVEEYDGSPSWLYTSNFQRSFQTALVMREDLGLLFSEVRTEFSGLLDPRKMGSLDFQDQSNWKEVWENDLKDPLSTPPPVSDSLQPSASVESVRDLYRRTLEAFTRLEATYFGTDIVLVSHADTLSCFCAALYGTDLGRHHLDYPFELGEVKCVDLSGIPEKGSKMAPTDIQGEYAVGDKAVNYL